MLSALLIIYIKVAYALNFLQAGQILCPNCLYAYWLSAAISLPDIRKSSGHIAQGFIIQLHPGEDSRLKEEGMGIKSEPQAK